MVFTRTVINTRHDYLVFSYFYEQNYFLTKKLSESILLKYNFSGVGIKKIFLIHKQTFKRNFPQILYTRISTRIIIYVYYYKHVSKYNIRNGIL